MDIINFEFKARSKNIDELEEKLLKRNPIYAGEDHQIDTYFQVAEGRVKLREGTIENSLIFYERENVAEAKVSKVILYKFNRDPSLKDILLKLAETKVVVDKRRKIYFLDNIKFHFDTVKGLGQFFEVEAIDKDGDIGEERLKQQVAEYQAFFGVQPEDIIAQSYSDLIVAL